ncbi:hypothetical protein Rhe02_53400 [Rhizocola hellebori]|uniref:Uncharacterized protein n=1 Tax=Rhizocola hellebori TaxID=1392758 RepID=A0A8J3VIT9_9ACTN|nr:hypothetical protein Rhe02_53400 [Rhizocola hellebori]
MQAFHPNPACFGHFGALRTGRHRTGCGDGAGALDSGANQGGDLAIYQKRRRFEGKVAQFTVPVLQCHRSVRKANHGTTKSAVRTLHDQPMFGFHHRNYATHRDRVRDKMYAEHVLWLACPPQRTRLP